MMVRDSRRPDIDDEIEISNYHNVPPFETIDVRHAQSLLRFMIQDLEFHEIDEWLKVDGVLVFDPHANQTSF